MDLPASMLIGLGVLAIAALAVFQVVRVYSEGGFKLFFWPKLRHGYEVTPVTRLAVAPWLLLLFLLAGNGIVIALFGHDVLGQGGGDFKPWLIAALVPMALIHLIDYRRSVTAAVLGLLLLSAASIYVLLVTQSWALLPLLLVCLLWSLNGVRALHADRSMS